MAGLFDLSGGKSSGKNETGVWDAQVPYLQALYQLAFGQSGAQTGQNGPTGPGGTPDPMPIRPIPTPGHSRKGDIARYNQQMAQWTARNGQNQAAGGTVQPPQAPVPGTPGSGMAQQPGPGMPGMPPQTSGSPQANQGQGQNPLGNIGPYSANLANNLFQQAQGQSPYLQQQIGNLGNNIGQFWNQQLLPGIANEAGGFGQYGGSRQGIAQGLGAQQAIQSFQQGATDLYANNWNNGADRAQGLYNLGMAPFAAQWAPLQALGGLLGSPTILGSGSQSAWNAGVGFGPGGGNGGKVPT